MTKNKNQIVDGIELSEGVEFIPEFHSTEIDLDRDVPSGPIVWDGCGPNAGSYPGWEGWNVWDKEDENGEIVLTINPNNDEQPDQYDGDWVSECCGAELIFNDQLCGDCKEHADPIPEYEEDLEKAMNERFAFDKYCENNPDFNAALNGHWEYV